jgi:hypothetical protein
MVWHQAPGEDIGERTNMNLDFSEEIKVIFPNKEDLSTVVSLIVNVINLVGKNVHNTKN